jgi:hypothetical protein
MSYSLRIVKDAEGIRLDENAHHTLAHLPAECTLIINGHHVAAGDAGSESIGVTLAAEGNFFGANSHAAIDRRVPAEPAPAVG